MKKILLMGQFTDHFREINKSLTGKYEVRACVNKLEIFKGMFKLNKPDVVVMLINELNEANEGLFKELKKEHRDIPVVYTGINFENNVIPDYLMSKQLEYVAVPYTIENLIEKIEYAMTKDISEEENQKVPEKVTKEEKKSEKEEKEEKEEKGEKGEKGEKEEDKKTTDDSLPTEKNTGSNEHRKKSVLVVDDSGIFLRMMKGLLEDKYDVSVITSGLKAISLIHEKKPDLILLDYEMPLYDGRETMMKIRESESTKDIPIVFVTAVNDKEHIKAVLSQRPAGYLLKPLDKERLIKTVKEIIGE